MEATFKKIISAFAECTNGPFLIGKAHFFSKLNRVSGPLHFRTAEILTSVLLLHFPAIRTLYPPRNETKCRRRFLFRSRSRCEAGVQDSHIGEVSVLLCIVKTVADRKFIRNLYTAKIEMNIYFPRCWLAEKSADFE